MKAIKALRNSAKVALTRYPCLYRVARPTYGLARYVLRRPHDKSYAVFALFPGRIGPFLDVGANAGMSILSFRLYNRRSPIVSVEPNRFHRADLRIASFVARRSAVIWCAAGATRGIMTLYVPVYRGVPLTTEASLSKEAVLGSSSLRGRLRERMDSDSFCVHRQDVHVRPLDELALDPDFIKIDVEGAELDALRGLRVTLTRSRPVLLVECPSVGAHELLVSLGYDLHSFDPSTRMIRSGPGSGPNSLYLHHDDAASRY